MWERFFAAYAQRKGKSTKASSLGRVIALLRGYERGKGTQRIAEIREELTKVKKAWRLFSENPAVKYAVAIAELEHELHEEELAIRQAAEADRLAVGRRARMAAATSAEAYDASPRAGDPSSGVSALNATGNKERMRVAYAGLLASKKTEPEHCRKLQQAFIDLCSEPAFAKYYLDEVGWRNARAWATWALRAVTPEMVAGPAARDAATFLREVALRAGVVGKPYAERYLLELSIYCQAAADKVDVSFVIGQATSIVGPLVSGVLTRAIGGGVVEMLADGAHKGLTIAANQGAQALAVDGDGKTTVAITQDGREQVTAMNVMRFTHAWLRYVTENKTGSAHATIVRNEFGGRRGCELLLEQLEHM